MRTAIFVSGLALLKSAVCVCRTPYVGYDTHLYHLITESDK